MLKKQIGVLLLMALFTGCADAGNTVAGTVETESRNISAEESSEENETAEISHTYETETETAETNIIENEENPETFQETETAENEDDTSPNFLSDKKNLKRTLETVAMYYDNFEDGIPASSDFWDKIIDVFFENSWYGTDYLSEIEGYEISKEQIEYFAYSLTGEHRSYDGIKDDEMLDISNSSSPNYTGWIFNPEIKAESNGQLDMTADYFVTFHSIDGFAQKHKLEVTLMENPDSCLDGYSILSQKVYIPDNTDWARLYHEWLETDCEKYFEGNIQNSISYLIYADEDYVPELYITDNEEECSILLTVINDKVECMYSWNGQGNYYKGYHEEEITKQDFDDFWNENKMDKKLEMIDIGYRYDDSDGEAFKIKWMLKMYYK